MPLARRQTPERMYLLIFLNVCDTETFKGMEAFLKTVRVSNGVLLLVGGKAFIASTGLILAMLDEARKEEIKVTITAMPKEMKMALGWSTKGWGKSFRAVP